MVLPFPRQHAQEPVDGSHVPEKNNHAVNALDKCILVQHGEDAQTTHGNAAVPVVLAN